MASSTQVNDPLGVLQEMLNQALVQTGKALRASRKDAPKDTSQGSLNARLPETIRTFHGALDDLEVQIIRAKAVLARDLSRLQTQAAVVEAPQPVDAQSKEPMFMDIESSPPVASNALVSTDVKVEVSHPQSVAPVPDMGTAPVASMDVDAAPPQVPQVSSAQEEPKETLQQSAAPPAPMDMSVEEPLDPKPADQSNSAPSANDMGTGLNFTNMQFTLVPGNEDPQQQGMDHDSSNFNPPDGDDLLDGLLPDDIDPVGDQPQNNEPSAAQNGNATDSNGNEVTGNNADTAMMDTALEDILGLDLANADGSDFDFGIDGGGSTFDDLMSSHDVSNEGNNMDMQPGGFDNVFEFDDLNGPS